MKRHKDLGLLLKERDAALLSKDKQTIVTFMRKYGLHVPSDRAFWPAVHKAIARNERLPEAERIKSRLWLSVRGFSS